MQPLASSEIGDDIWITHILASGFLAVEIYLLAVKRSRSPKQESDGGTLRLVWILIGGGCLVVSCSRRRYFFCAGPIVGRSFSWRVCC